MREKSAAVHPRRAAYRTRAPRPSRTSSRPRSRPSSERPPPGPGRLAEMKFDGYRILARLDRGKVSLKSRNENDWTAKFSSIACAVAEELDVRAAYLDGEVAIVRPDGTTSFQALQNLAGGGAIEGVLVYFVFDLLHLDGFDLTRAPLEARKAELERIVGAIKGPTPIRYAAHVVDQNEGFFEQAGKHGLEGIVCKRREGPNLSGRSRDWLKVKCIKRQEFVVGGFTEPEGSRPGIGGLLVGVYDKKGDLVFAGGVGTGFTQGLLRELRKEARSGSPAIDLAVLDAGRRARRRPVVGSSPSWSPRSRSPSGPTTTSPSPPFVSRHARRQGPAHHRPRASGRRDRTPALAGAAQAPLPDRARAHEATAVDARAAAAPREPRALGRAAAVRRGKADEEAAPSSPASTSPIRRASSTPSSGLTKLAVARFYEAIAPHGSSPPSSIGRRRSSAAPGASHKPCFCQKHRGLLGARVDSPRPHPVRRLGSASTSSSTTSPHSSASPRSASSRSTPGTRASPTSRPRSRHLRSRSRATASFGRPAVAAAVQVKDALAVLGPRELRQDDRRRGPPTSLRRSRRRSIGRRAKELLARRREAPPRRRAARLHAWRWASPAASGRSTSTPCGTCAARRASPPTTTRSPERADVSPCRSRGASSPRAAERIEVSAHRVPRRDARRTSPTDPWAAYANTPPAHHEARARCLSGSVDGASR